MWMIADQPSGRSAGRPRHAVNGALVALLEHAEGLGKAPSVHQPEGVPDGRRNVAGQIFHGLMKEPRKLHARRLGDLAQMIGHAHAMLGHRIIAAGLAAEATDAGEAEGDVVDDMILGPRRQLRRDPAGEVAAIWLGGDLLPGPGGIIPEQGPGDGGVRHRLCLHARKHCPRWKNFRAPERPHCWRP